MYNQSQSSLQSKIKKIQELLLDNQSTYNIIINLKIIKNVQYYRQMLCLQTQTVEYIIDKISSIIEARTILFYLQGAANILSQFRIVVYRKQNVYYNNNIYHQIEDLKDFVFQVVTQQRYSCKSVQNSQVSYVHKKNFKSNRKIRLHMQLLVIPLQMRQNKQ